MPKVASIQLLDSFGLDYPDLDRKINENNARAIVYVLNKLRSPAVAIGLNKNRPKLAGLNRLWWQHRWTQIPRGKLSESIVE